jgi:PBSX family phage terminase large subunit
MTSEFKAQSGLIKTVIKYRPYGAIKAAFTDKSPELIIDGPAGTGKSRGLIEKLHLCLTKYAGARGLMVRKTRTSMTETCMFTYERKVLHELDKVRWSSQDQKYYYPNGSELVVGGMDKATKIMSSEYDIAYAQECTELTLGDWESITTRLRNGVMPYQQIIGDCNPDGPKHWIKHREVTGALRMIPSSHEDNPVLWNHDRKEWTEFGRKYIAKLDALTGVRYYRLRKGLWVAAQGVIYDEWDPQVHMIDYFPIPEEWPRIWAVDFGFTNPFCWKAYAEDPDGRLICYREIYKTQTLVEDHARMIKAISEGEPQPYAIICDHDAEDRATLERYLEMPTLPAFKPVSAGIQAVKSRLKKAGDGRARLLHMRDSLVERDPLLVDQFKPTCTAEEYPTYVWDEKTRGKDNKEVPVKKDDHGVDVDRYAVAFVDSLSDEPFDELDDIYTLDDEMRVVISPY